MGFEEEQKDEERKAEERKLRRYGYAGAAVLVCLIVGILIWRISGKTVSETLDGKKDGKKTEHSVKKEEEKATDDAILAVIAESLDKPVKVVSESAIAANTKREQLLAEKAAAEEEARRQAAEAEAKAKAEAQAKAEAAAKAEAEKAAREQAQAEAEANADTWQPSTTYTPVPTQPTQSVDTSTYVDEVIRLVNEERAKAGVAPLAKNASLCQAAGTRSQEISSVFEHTRPNGQSCFSILEEMGISYMGCGENIAMGQRTPEEVVRGWMNSPGHRANILDETFEEIGVGVTSIGGILYWVQLFRKVG